MHKRSILYITIITLAALLAGICPGLVVSVSSQEIPSYSILLEFDKDLYYTGETAYFDVRLFNGQEPVALGSLGVEAVLLQEEKALPLKEYKGGRGAFSCILEANENSAIEVTVYRKNRQERTRALLARKAKFLKDIERLRDSRWFLFWKREKIEREIDQLGKTVEKIESSVEQLNAPLAKASKSVVVLSRPAILLNAADEENIKETEMVVIPLDDADSPPDTSESFSPAPPGSHDFAEGPLEKTVEIVPEKPRTSGPPEVVKKLFQAGEVSMPPQKQEKIIPKEGISRKEGSETLAASTPPAAYIPPFYSRVKDTIPPVTSSDYKKSGIVTNEDVRITLQAADNAKGAEKTFYRINGGSWKGYDRPITGFANGEHVVEYYSIDKDGNKEDPPHSVTVRIDRTPPALTVSYPSSTQENTIALNGTVSEDTGVLTMDGHQVLLKGGTFSIAHVSLPARKNVFRFEAIDQAGNKTVRDVAIECLWDKTAPAIAIKGIERGVFYPKAVTPVVSVDDAQSKVTMSMVLNGETFLSGTPISKDGKYTLSVEAVDAYENHAGISVSFSVDRTAPETKDDYRKTDAWSHDDAKIVLLAADTGAGVESIYYRIGGGAFAAYQSPIEIQEEGIHRIQYYAQDRLGNKESFKTTTVKIDKTPPAIDLKAEELTVEAADILTPVNFSSPDVKDNLDNAVRLSSEHLSKQGYPLGTTQVLYRAVDHAGNSSSAVTNVRIQDSTAPRISLDFPRDNSYAAHTVNVSGRCEEIFLKHLLINGEKVDVVDGQFARTIPVAGDKFEVEVKAADTSGNEGAVSRTVLRDILPPETGHDYAHDGVWTRENARITLSALDDGSGAKTTYFREENEPFLEYRRPIDIRKEGKYKVEYYSIDEVGNEEARRNVSVWIDQTPPALKITSPRDGAYVSGGTVEVRGTAGDAFLSRVLVNGRPATVSSGNFVSMVPLEGEKIILTAEAFDELGHQNSDSVNVILDASLPVTTDDYAFDNVWGNQDARIHLAATDAGSGIQATYYRIYAEGTNPPAFVSRNPGDVIIIDQEGKWTVEYYSMDQVEGRESHHFISVLLDKTAPVTADNHGGHVDPTNKDVVIVFAATDAGSGVEAIYYRLDKASFAPVTGPITVSQDGTHVLEYYALDRAGNEEARKTLEIPVDKTPPQIMVDSPPDGSTIEENTVVIKGAVSGDTVALTLNGQSVPPLNSTFLVNNFKLTPGENKITLVAQDGVGNQTTLEITVAKVNRPPVLDPVSDITVNEGQAVNFHPTGSDPDGDSVTFSYSGWMTSASYTTTHDDAGAHTVTVTASDGDLTASRDVRVTVNNVNRPPVLDSVADVFVNEGETVNLNPAAGDPDGDSVIFSYSGWMTSSSHVTTYDDAGQRTVTVTVSDGNLTDSQNVTVIVSNVNRPPGADTKKVLLNEDTPTGIVLTGSDPDQNSLNYALVSAPAHGVLSGGAPQLIYTPNKDYNGPDAFTFKVNDGSVDSGAATVDLLVQPVNDAPALAAVGNKSVEENAHLEFAVTAADAEGDVLTITAASLKSWMSFDGTVFAADPGFGDSGNYAVTFTVSDGTLTDTEAVIISVGDVNRPPQLALIGDRGADEGGSLQFVLSAGDPDGDTLHFAASNLPAGSNFNADTRTFFWQPGYDQAGVFSGVHFEADDGEFSDSEDIVITVHNVNRAPVLNPMADMTVDEGATVVLNPTAVDPDGDSIDFTYFGWMNFAERVTGYEDTGVHTVSVTASDGYLTDSQYVTVTVNNVNRAPVLDPIADISVGEGETVNFNPTASDPDGDNLTFIYSGWMTSASYTTGYGDAGTYKVTVTVTDGNLTDAQDVNVAVANTNRPPVLNPAADITVNEGETVILNAAGSDPDGDNITITYAGWMNSSSRTTGYTDAGVHTVTVTISDGTLTDSQDVTVTVVNVNRAPVLDFIFDLAVYEGETITFKPTASDPDGDALTFTYSGWMSSSGHAVTRNDGGSHTVTVSVSDGQDTDSQDVIVTVEVCGDGIKNGPEICDEGTNNGTPNHCNAQCAGTTAGVCGNNIKESGEACDDGNKVSGDGCSTSCVKEYCGDNIVQTGLGETCEGNSIKSCVVGGYAGVQSCTNCTDSGCVPGESCGDGTIQTAAGEACDDGNKTSGDGCSVTCKLESCGDDIIQTGLGEQCDDGNQTPGDGCNAGCKDEYCGDEIVQINAGEVCDSNARACTTSAGYSGTQNCGIQCIGFNACTTNLFCGDGVCSNPPETTISCPSDCPAICGNGIAEPSEECDDRNTTSGDGCSATCKLEICGDGIVQTGHGEQCDDGNTANGDGCSSTCQREQVVDTTPPSMPAGLSCSVISTSQINLSWSASSDNVGVTGYRVYRNSSQVATAANTAYQNTGLNPATTYTYNVAAYDAAGNVSNQSSAVQCATQNPPDTTAPAVSVTSPLNNASVSGTTTVSATASDNVEIAGVQFKLDGVTLQTEDTASPYSINWNTATAPNGAHTLTATARDTAGNTANSSTVTVTVNNLVTPGDSILTNPGFESGTSPWFFYTNGAGTFNADAAGEASAHAGHVVISQAGTNVQLYQANLTLEPNASYRLTFKAYSNTGHDISVSLQKHGSPYTVYGLSGRVFDLTSSWGQFSVQFTTAGFSNTVNDGRLMFWLAPYASGADEYFIDDVVLEKVISADQEDTTPPSMPSGLTATAVSSSQINLGWSASTDNVGVAGYRVFRNNIQVATSMTASYSNTGLSPNTTYTFTVSAYDAAGNTSSQSSPVQATTKAQSAGTTITVDFNANRGLVAPYHRYMNHIEKVRGSIDHQRVKDLGPTVERAYWVLKDWAIELGVYDFSTQGGRPYGSDPLFDDVIANGGEMLIAIQGNPSIKLPVWLQSSNPDFPNNLDHYQTVLEDGLRHIKQKYPQFKYLQSQNEPGGEIKVTADEFKLMHERVQLAANTVNQELPANVPKIIVGGPGMGYSAGGMDTRYTYLGTILDYISGKNLPLGFLSWHTYSETPKGHVTILNQYYDLMTKWGYDSPMFVTESGYMWQNPDNWPNTKCLVPSNPDPTNIELAQSAAYMMAAYLQYLDSGKNVTPFVFALHDYANNARSVLVYKCIDSRDGKVNPLYNALLMWSKLTGTRVEATTSDTNSSLNGVRGVAVKDGMEVRILVFNRDLYSAKTTKVILNNLPSQFLNSPVTYKRYLVDRQHNNYAANPAADLMKWEAPLEQSPMLLSNGQQLEISLDPDAVSLLVFSATGTPSQADTTVPSVPSGLTATARSSSQIDLSWTVSTDNVGVTGYKIYRDGALVVSLQSSVVSFSDTGLVASTVYSYTVSAYDAAGNESGTAGSVSAATFSTAASSDYFDWSVRTDRDGKPAGIFTTTPFPVIETDTAYSITNDEGTKTYTLGTIYFVDNGATGCANGAITYDPSTRACGSGFYAMYTNLSNAFAGTTNGNKTLLVRAGTYTHAYLNPRIGTDDTHRYYIVGYNQERPVIDGGSVNAQIFSGFAGSAAEAYVTFQRLEIRNSNQECMQAGSYSSEIDGSVNFIDLDVHSCCLAEVGCDANIILIDQDDSWFYHNNVHRAGNHGIKVADNSDRALIEWNRVYEIGWWAGEPFDVCGTHCVAIDLVSHEAGGDVGLNNVVRYNIVHDTYSYALNSEHQDTPIIHHNEIYNAFRVYDIDPSGAAAWVNSSTQGAYSVDINESPKGSFYSNVIRDKRGGYESLNDHGHLQFWASTAQIPAGAWEVYNNLFYDSEAADTVEHVIQTSGNFQAGSTVNIYNNTLYADTVGGDDTLIAKSTWSGTMNIKNNILYQAGAGKVISGSPAVDYNLYYYPGGSLGIAPGVNDINNTNPLFIQAPSGTYDANDGNIQSASPAINAGIDLISNFTSSFPRASLLRPQGSSWDIGAYEYVGTAPDTAPPSVPQNLTVQAISSTQIDLSWSVSTDDVGVAGYNLYRDGSLLSTVNSSQLACSDTGLSPATSYIYTVSAYDEAGNESAVSGPVSTTTQSAPDTLAPSVPTGLTATAVSSSQINLAWTASTDNAGVAGYRVFRNNIQVAASTTASYSSTGLSANTNYAFTVSAYDAAGNESAESTSVSATTQPATSGAANHYVRVDATGANNGSDWTNAYAALPATLVRGDTYYIADGTYPSYTFDDLVSGSLVITIKKATIADHGTSTGWQSFFGDGQAVFGALQFYNDYYVFDGVTGGGPSNWESGFGFRIKVAGGKNIRLENGASYLTFKHVDMENGGKDTHQSNDDILYAITGNENIAVSYSYMHDVARVMLLTSRANGFILEYTKLARNGGGGDTIHREAWSEQGAADNVTIRHNIFEDISNTAFIALVNGNGDAENWEIYGNVFWHTGNFPGTGVSSLITTKYATSTFVVAKNWKFYNNAIVNVNGSTNIRYESQAGINEAYNNVWYKNIGNTVQISGTHDYNWFFDNRRLEGCNPYCEKDTENNELHRQLGTADPFVDWQNRDFRLTAQAAGQMQLGLSLLSPYNIDPTGALRGTDGTWDRGAYEYAADTTYDVPSDRRIDWSPGIPGGTSTNHNLCANVKNSPYNAVGDGLADDTAAFQSALAACPSGTYVYVPSGTYKLTTGLTIPGGVLLKGDGPALSKLKDYQPAGSYFVQMSGQSSSVTANITAGYAKDSTQITVDSATGLNVNDYIMISQLNEAGLATDRGYGNTCTWCGPRDLNERAMAQIVKVTAINGNDLTLNRPVYYASAGYSPQAMKLGSSVRINSGIQDLYLERVNTAGSGYNIIFMQFCVNCRVKNVETYKTGGAHIRMSYTYGNEIRDNYFHEAWGYGSGAGYGILMIHTNSDNLIENNIFNLTRHSVVMEGGGSGNVIAYNYSKDPYDSDSPTWLSGDMITHGAHPYMNLFEGNYAANFENDNTWGSSSHNTYFRNHANRSRSITTALAQRAIDVQANNHYMNYVGNVLGPATGGGTEGPGTNCGTQPIDWRAQGCNTPSGTENPPTDSTVAPTILRHGNYSYASGNTQWDPGMSNHNLPASYYLLSKPSFFGDLPWPGIGPDLNPVVGVLPAKARFDAL